MAQVVQDALALGLLHEDALKAMVAPHAAAYGQSGPAEFVRVLVGEGRRR